MFLNCMWALMGLHSLIIDKILIKKKDTDKIN